MSPQPTPDPSHRRGTDRADAHHLLDGLRARLPADAIQDDPDVVAAYAQDRALFERPGTAAVLVMPRSTQEVVAAIEAANAAAVPIVARGAGTGLAGAANAVDGCIILSLHRMAAIVDIDVTNRMARVQPGVVNADLKRAVADHGLFYPPDPASFETSTIGGNVATNAGGLCCVKYGVTRDFVIGLEVVLASGEVMRTGRHTLKSTTGLDLTGLFVGSEGLLGIITEVTVRLVPAPPPPSTLVASFDDLPAVGVAVAAVFRAGLEPSVMEVIDQASLRQVEAAFRMGLDTDAACLLVAQAAGDDSSATIAAMATACVDAGAGDVHHTDDPVEGELLLDARRKVWPALEQLGRTLLPEDIAVPRQRLAELLAGIVAIARRHDVQMPTIGHAGDGNLHPVFVIDPGDADEFERARAAFAAVVDLALELDGTIAGEHGIGTLKRAFIERELDPVQLAAQRAVKDALDPAGRFNPGKAL